MSHQLNNNFHQLHDAKTAVSLRPSDCQTVSVNIICVYEITICVCIDVCMLVCCVAYSVEYLFPDVIISIVLTILSIIANVLDGNTPVFVSVSVWVSKSFSPTWCGRCHTILFVNTMPSPIESHHARTLFCHFVI